MSYTNMPDVERGDILAMADVKIHILPKKHRFNIEERCLITNETSRQKSS